MENNKMCAAAWRLLAAAALAAALASASVPMWAGAAYGDEAYGDFAGSLYETVLDRDADEGGLAAHVAALEEGASPSQIACNFLESDEYLAKGESAEQTVARCYRSLLGREPEGGEDSAWVGLLESGEAVESVVGGFGSSDEYLSRIASLGLAEPGEEPADPAAAQEAAFRDEVVERAMGYVGRQVYSLGACSPNAMDCSGFVMYCLTGSYSRVDAATGAVAYTGTYIQWERTDDPQPGDVCVYHDPARYPEYHGHCGIYVGDGKMVDCGSPVAVRDVDPQMVFVRYPGV